ncbi:MAG TPA: ABC-F family ATP-binding cassette domain-containing protein, partial [Deinococcales bacterium]|nr:ABC-F family ATP-binding cassette domain-containing protein [Deinococcales bacterium]
AAVLHALGFTGREDEPVRQLSGGEKTRLGLARLLMAQPDLLLLDEPTNHLDMEMRDWLAGHLSRYDGAMLLISHDRDFLDGACGQTAEVRNGRVRYFEGNPSAYRHARAEQERIEERTRHNERKEQARLQAAADRMKGWAGQNEKLHRRATAMYRRLERFEDGMLEDAEKEQGSTRFTFECGPTGNIVLQAEHLSRAFAGRSLFEDVDVTLRSGDRVALLGPNGAGKTTFVQTLTGDEPSDDPRGHTRTGSRVHLGYYDQELRDVDPERTLVEELISLTGETEAHNLLGRFMFPYAAQFKRIKDLSGGEKARLALLKLTLGEYSFLVLDEPTNHLDTEMIEALEAALAAYPGTLFIVSHDRRFVRNVTDTVWELRDGHLEKYAGGIDYWHRKRQELLAAASAETEPAAPQRKGGREPERRRGPSRWQLER